jgi:N-acetylmuramoyl-L-alanine amidase
MNIIWHPSPNFRESNGRQITCIVLHATATEGLKSPLDWLCNPISKVSAHYLIGIDGVVYNLVKTKDIAYHAGESEWKGKDHVNTFSVGIELVNKNDGKMLYPKEQTYACIEIVKDLMFHCRIKHDDVVRHADVAPGRKNDPLGFDLLDFRRQLL